MREHYRNQLLPLRVRTLLKKLPLEERTPAEEFTIPITEESSTSSYENQPRRSDQSSSGSRIKDRSSICKTRSHSAVKIESDQESDQESDDDDEVSNSISNFILMSHQYVIF